MVASKDGHIIYKNLYNDVQDLVSGTLRILNRGKYGLIYKTGEEILPVRYDAIEKLDVGQAQETLDAMVEGAKALEETGQ